MPHFNTSRQEHILITLHSITCQLITTICPRVWQSEDFAKLISSLVIMSINWNVHFASGGIFAPTSPSSQQNRTSIARDNKIWISLPEIDVCDVHESAGKGCLVHFVKLKLNKGNKVDLSW